MPYPRDAWAVFCPTIIFILFRRWAAKTSNVLTFQNLDKIQILVKFAYLAAQKNGKLRDISTYNRFKSWQIFDLILKNLGSSQTIQYLPNRRGGMRAYGRYLPAQCLGIAFCGSSFNLGSRDTGQDLGRWYSVPRHRSRVGSGAHIRHAPWCS
jgi:hypothetical protein